MHHLPQIVRRTRNRNLDLVLLSVDPARKNEKKRHDPHKSFTMRHLMLFPHALEAPGPSRMHRNSAAKHGAKKMEVKKRFQMKLQLTAMILNHTRGPYHQNRCPEVPHKAQGPQCKVGEAGLSFWRGTSRAITDKKKLITFGRFPSIGEDIV